MSVIFVCDGCGESSDGIAHLTNPYSVYSPHAWWALWNGGDIKHACSDACRLKVNDKLGITNKNWVGG